MPIGERCLGFAREHLPEGTLLADDMNSCEVFISVFYNQLITKEFINSREQCLNFHAGILPQYRGSGTINWAIINGEKETGVTLHEIDEKIDHGDVIEVRSFPLGDMDTCESVFKKTEKLVFQMFCDWFQKLALGKYTAIPQDHSKARLYSRADLQKAKDLTPYVRAYHLPGKEAAYYYNRKGEKVYLEW